MASSKKPANNSPLSPGVQASRPQVPRLQTTRLQHLSLQVFFADFFKHQQVHHPNLLIALSGGLDSIVLLHLMCQLRKTLPFNLSAMHVHHGLSANADAWAQFCQQICEQWQVPLTISRVQVNRESGLGLEAAARAARYQALAGQSADFICLAHHQDDQAETLLLQLGRGAGAKGLTGMAQYDAKRKLLRPLLSYRRADLMAYAQSKQLHWVEDESNSNTHFDRNFMRHQLIPAFKQRYPAITQTLSRSASHLAETAALCDDLAAIDANTALENIHADQTLNLDKVKHLSPARQVNLLRWWLAQQDLEMPSTAQMQQIVQQLFYAADDASVAIKVAQHLYLKRFQQRAYLVKAAPKVIAIHLLWNNEPEIGLPDQSRLLFTQQTGVGLALKWLQGAKLSIQYRQDGEQLKPEHNRPARSLKYVFNEAGVPPWLRQSWPLLFLNDQLAIVPNIAVDARFKTASDELGLQVSWVDARDNLVWASQ